MSRNEIPGDKTRIDRSFEVISDHNAAILEKIAENPDSGLVHKYYMHCMDITSINKLGAKPIIAVQGELSTSNSVAEAVPFNGAILLKHGLSGLFNFRTDIDALNPSKRIYFFSQGGLSLPDPSYYALPYMMGNFEYHISNMFNLENAPIDARIVSRFEQAIANITVPAEDLFDPFTSYNRMSWDELIKLAPNLNFEKFIQDLGLDRNVNVALDAPKFFADLSTLIGKTPLANINAFFRWKMLDQTATFLSTPFINENFDFYGRVLSGQKEQPQRKKTCLSATNDVVPELAGTLFAKQAFPDSSKEMASQIFETLLSSFESNVQKLTWMDPQTLRRALDKLNKVDRLIGYPDHPRTYSEYEFNWGYFANYLLVGGGELKRQLSEINLAPRRDVWAFGPYVINAAYDPTRNSETLPAGIIQAPYFDPNYPPALNYGGIGMVGGHELTHSLDSQGRDYNGEGKLEDWWTPTTSAAFQKRVDCIIQQYSKFSPLPGFFVNGNLTQGENIADAGGLKTTHAAFVKRYPNEAYKASVVPGLTNEQLLFVGYAQTWCSKFTPNVVKQRLLTDPHSPPRFRVNGPAMNLPAYTDAFKCKQGVDPMAPNDRCEIW